MKTTNFQNRFLAAGVVAVLVLAVETAPAQNSTKTPNLVASQTEPAMSSAVSQVIQLSKANIGEKTIVAFVQNSQCSYGLDAAQIIYLKQQGVAESVINAMISQRASSVSGIPAATASTAPPSYRSYTIAQSPKAAANWPNTQTNYVATQPVMVQTVPTDYPNYYYPYYGYYWPPVAFSFGFGGGWHGGFRR
jgi:hypothetical protein